MVVKTWLDRLDAITTEHAIATAWGVVLGMVLGGLVMFCLVMFVALGGLER